MDTVKTGSILTLAAIAAVAGAFLAPTGTVSQTATCGTVTTCPNVSTPVSGTELFYVVQSGVSKKITYNDLAANMPGGYGGPVGGDLTGTLPNPTIKSSVNLTGNPTTTTQSGTDSSTRIATTAHVKAVPMTGVLGGTIASPSFAANALSSINFIPPGTGGITQSQQARNQAQIFLSDYCASGATDCSPALVHAMTQAISIGTKTVISGGTWNFTTTVPITSSHADIECAATGTVLRVTGNINTFTVGYQAGEIGTVRISNCFLEESGKSGGFSINAKNVSNLVLDRLTIDHPYNGMYFERFNNVSVTFATLADVRGVFGIRLYANPASDRADVFQIQNSSVNCNWHGGQGFSVDGYVTTMRFYGVNFLDCNYGFHVDNSAASADKFPTYFEAHGLEIDGATTNALRFDGGADFMCTACVISNTSGTPGQGGADGPSLVIGTDAGRAQRFLFSASQIKDSCVQAASINAKFVTFSGSYLGDASKCGGASNVVDVFGASVAVSFSGTMLDGFTRSPYTIAFDNAAAYYAVVGNVSTGYTVGDILYSGAAANKVVANNAK